MVRTHPGTLTVGRLGDVKQPSMVERLTTTGNR